MDQPTTESTGDEMTFFFGAAGGSAQKALRTLGEPNVMLSYGIDYIGKLVGETIDGELLFDSDWITYLGPDLVPAVT